MLPERLTQTRLHRKLTRQNMADKLGINKHAYGRYETGKRDISTETLSTIADILNVSVDYLLGRTDIPIPNLKLDHDGQEQFEAFINDPEVKPFFKNYLDAPKERIKELMFAWSVLKKAEEFRKLTESQDSDTN